VGERVGLNLCAGWCRKGKDCQPNFRKNVHPDPTKSCGPYRPITQDVRRAALASDEASRVLEKLLTKVSGEARELTEVFKAGMQRSQQSSVRNRGKKRALCDTGGLDMPRNRAASVLNAS
jgi:hypothetical protein